MFVGYRLYEAAGPSARASFEQLLATHAVVGALILGALYGVLVAIAPDHIGTMFTLTVASDDASAFRVGAVWGFTHAAGMALIILALSGVEKVSGLSGGEKFEVFSEYAVGFSMMACALYFIIREDHYIKDNHDGTQSVRACECCHSSVTPTKVPRRRKFCDAYQYGDAVDPDVPPDSARASTNDTESGEEVPPSEEGLPSNPVSAARPWLSWSPREVNGAIMGAVQGMCCPMSLVGTTFAGFLSTPERCAVFGLGFLVCSTASTGAMAMILSWLGRRGSFWLSPQTIYRATCAFTMTLGAVWIMANATGHLHTLDWTDRLLQHQHHHDTAQPVGT